MVNVVYGLVLGIFFIPLSIACVCYIFWKRYNNFARVRNPILWIIQTCGISYLIVSSAFYIGTKSSFGCNAMLVVYWLAVPFFVFPFLLRCWEYCANFHIADTRAQVDILTLMGGDQSRERSKSWFLRHRNAGNGAYLLKMYLATFWILVFPVVPIVIMKGKASADGCATYDPALYMLYVGVFVSLAGIIVLAVLLRKARDAFYIRYELIALAILWLIITPSVIFYNYSKSPIRKTFTNSALLLVAFMLTFIITVVFPIVVVFKDERSRGKKHATQKYDQFISRLALPSFRNAFFQFLSLQFCAENLLFYEVAADWKARNGNKSSRDEERARGARVIIENFIENSGDYQINITSSTRENIRKCVLVKEYPADMFDTATKEVIEMIYLNSYHLFLKSRLFAESNNNFRTSLSVAV